MSAQNIHWPTFLAFEQELLDLTYNIHFDDKQIHVYSLKIADMILKISSELESVANDIYRKHTSRKPSKASESLQWIQDNWQITNKHVSIIAPSVYFTKNFQPSFAPFQYSNDGINDYYKAYCAIKHDKSKNLGKANINVLIRCFASLYLLNLYWGGDGEIENNQSKVFASTKAGLGIGLFVDFGISMTLHLKKCSTIDLYGVSYYLYRDKHQQEIRNLINALSKEEKRKFRTIIIENQDNPYFLIGKLLAMAIPGITVGDMLVKQNKINDDYLYSEKNKTLLNYGYAKVYIPETDMRKSYAQLDTKLICDRFDVT